MIMGVFKNLFSKRKTYPEDFKFKLCIINEDGELMSEVLGITDKRATEIAKFTNQAYNNHDRKTDSINEFIGHCVHINEVVFAYECYTKISHLKMQQQHISGIMGKLFGGEH